MNNAAVRRFEAGPSKTHCKRGHPTTPQHVKWNGHGWTCYTCNLLTSKRNRKSGRKANPFGFALNELRRNAKKRGLEFSITVADFPELPSRCPILDEPLDYSGAGGPNAASFDRIDSSKGYLPGNVAIISKRANTLKNDMTVEHARKLLEYMLRDAGKNC